MPSPLNRPETDATPIFEHFRGALSTQLLTAAVKLNVFTVLNKRPLPLAQLREQLGLQERPAIVLLTALRAMQLISVNARQEFALTPLAAEHLVSGAPFDVSDYVGLVGEDPGVLAMIEVLRANKPANAEKKDKGAAFIYREGLESAMEQEASARRLTLALAGRAKNVAPYLAQNVPLQEAKVLLDIGGGTGIYSIACVAKNPNLRAIVWDRPEVLKVAGEFAQSYGVADRVELRPGDMFADAVPSGADVVLLSNILHDWDVPECRKLIAKSATALPSGGRILIHDVLLNDALDGPLPIALYSATLFSLTEGRAYSAAEYKGWLQEAGLRVEPTIATAIHCAVLTGRKP